MFNSEENVPGKVSISVPKKIARQYTDKNGIYKPAIKKDAEIRLNTDLFWPFASAAQAPALTFPPSRFHSKFKLTLVSNYTIMPAINQI